MWNFQFRVWQKEMEIFRCHQSILRGWKPPGDKFLLVFMIIDFLLLVHCRLMQIWNKFNFSSIKNNWRFLKIRKIENSQIESPISRVKFAFREHFYWKSVRISRIRPIKVSLTSFLVIRFPFFPFLQKWRWKKKWI